MTKLRQSSLDSFIINPTKILTTTITTSTPDYELLRQNNIHRNQEFFKKLGITPPFKTHPPHKPKPKPKPKPTPLSTTPLRRSTRKLPPPLSQQEQPQEAESDTALDSTPEYASPSSVFKYTCDASRSFIDPLMSCSPISPLQFVGKPFRDPSLSKIYAVDVRYLKFEVEEKVLVAAGGHGGFISIYGGGRIDEDEEFMKEAREPLISWKSSRSWVSGVLFVEENPMLLVSSSNDGAIIVWDVGKQKHLSLCPPVVAESRDLHSSGIFSMDQLNGSIATAAKDSSVGICSLTRVGKLVTERTVSGHHLGAIRGVCFRDKKDILADCGADGRICVLDTRIPLPCTLTIDSQHSTGVNTVEWCPSNEFLLLSVSKDPTLLLYDIRNSTEPVHKLWGHVEPKAITCSQIYKPTFVDNGMAIATPGQGSKSISIYSIEKGNLFSRGAIGYDANLVLCTSDDGGDQRLWAAGKQINELCLMQLSKT